MSPATSRPAPNTNPSAQGWILAATILGSSMAFIDGTVVNVALPALQSSLHATIVGVQWVVEAYGLFLAALLLIGGAMGDAVGRRKIFLIGTVVFTLASVACGLAPTIEALIAARCVQGIGAALLVPSSLATISAEFPEESRGKAIGTWSGFTAITAALGPVLGGWLIEHLSWHWAFFINVPIGAAVIAISLARVPESRNARAERADWLGAITATAGLGGIVFAFVQSTSASAGWRTPYIAASLVAGCALIAAFLYIERHTQSPMMPLTLFASRSFTGANLLTFLLYAALGIFLFLFPLNLIQVHNYSTTAAGAAALPLILLMFLLSRWSGGLVAHYGAKAPLIVGPLIAAVGFLLFALPSVGGSYWTTFFPAFLVLGFGMAVSVAPLTTVVMSSVNGAHVGAASGVNNAVSRVASVLAVAVLGIVVVAAFGHVLRTQLLFLYVPSDIIDATLANKLQLANLRPPTQLDAATSATIRDAIATSFVSAFRLIMLICALLAAASAAVSALLIDNKKAAHANR